MWQEENVRKKDALKRKKEPERSDGKGPDKKRRKKEWWEKNDPQRAQAEEDDDVQHYRAEVCTSPIVLDVHSDICMEA